MPAADQSPPQPAPPESSRGAVFVPGFGCKGEGKDAKYGPAVAPTGEASLDEFLVDLQQPCSSSGLQTAEALADLSLLPHPNAATSEEVEEWITEGFKWLTNISTNMPPRVGDSILWRSITSGPRGQPPTKTEYFSTKVRYTAVDSDGELWCYVD